MIRSSMDTITRKYSNGEVTVVWKPQECVHSGVCFRGLGEVFDPKKRPWVSVGNSTTEKIIEQIKKCPSGALSFEVDQKPAPKSVTISENVIEPQQNGPLIIRGEFTLKNNEGAEVKINKTTALCRCGGSLKKPFCDGTHTKIGFVS